MLISRLSTPSKLEPVKVTNTSDSPMKLIKENNLDVLIFGDVTVVGNNISIDINVLDKKKESLLPEI